MPADPVTRFLGSGWRSRPRLVLYVGLSLTLLSMLLSFAGETWTPLRVILLLAGVVVVGTAVSIKLRNIGGPFEERLGTARFLAQAAVAALFAFWGTDPAWDSLAMLLVVLIAVALLGVLLVLLPTPARMIAAGVLVLAHFGGMIAAATTVDPPGASAPWVSMKTWLAYRPYLQFMYLNNAYHFYSPEPGPPALLWFHLKYKDGRTKWVKIPHRDTDPVPIHHTRLLSITESAAVASMAIPPGPIWNDLLDRRERNGRAYGIDLAPANVMPLLGQYQETQDYGVRMQRSYVRRIAYLYAGGDDNPLVGIKVYRLRHTIMDPKSMSEERDLLHPSLFVAFYQGEYDRDGDLLHVEDKTDAAGNIVDVKDPFRFWYIPVYQRRINGGPILPDTPADEKELVDGLTRHAQIDLIKGPKGFKPDPNDTPWDDAAEKQP